MTLAERIPHHSRLQFCSLNHVEGDTINPQWPVTELLMF